MADKYSYDKNTDYQAVINDAVAKGDWETARIAETQRNAKIRGEGLNAEQTYKYQNNFTPTSTTTATPTSFTSTSSTASTASSAPTYTQPEMSSEYKDALNNVLNFKEFSYDSASDPLYQNYKDQYTRNGQTASNNTLAQISARTGGLASSYAGQAAQQTYNSYMQALNDKVPELYQLAYSKYMDEFTMAQNKLSAAADYDEKNYSRNLDTYNVNYQAYSDAQDRALAAQQLEYEQSQTAYQNALNLATLAASYGDYSGLNGFGVDTSNLVTKTPTANPKANDDDDTEDTESKTLQSALNRGVSSGAISDSLAKQIAAKYGYDWVVTKKRT